MNRQALKIPFTLTSSPDWQCPTCKAGVLQLQADKFHKEELRGSRNHSHDEWDPEHIEYVYSCLLICSNSGCKEVVSNSGVGSVDTYITYDANGDPDQEYDDFFRPRYFEPHLKLVTIPDKCPVSVVDALNESFRLLFCSPAAASNCVRIAIEGLLTDLKVKRFDINKGKRRFISLHSRIALLPNKYSHLKDLLFAIKWLGNAGSHGNENGEAAVTMDDVMDAYELTEHVLKDVYATTTKKLRALAKKVNKRKGPVR